MNMLRKLILLSLIAGTFALAIPFMNAPLGGDHALADSRDVGHKPGDRGK